MLLGSSLKGGSPLVRPVIDVSEFSSALMMTAVLIRTARVGTVCRSCVDTGSPKSEPYPPSGNFAWNAHDSCLDALDVLITVEVARVHYHQSV